MDKAKLATVVFGAIFNPLRILQSFYHLNQTQLKACEYHAKSNEIPNERPMPMPYLLVSQN